MKVLITGSSGFVGGHLVSLVGGSHTVVPFDLKEGLDVRKSEMLNNKTKSIDAIVHLAALVVGPESWNKPWDYLETNGVGTFNVITSAIKNKVKRVIIVSSAAIYGAPLNPYGASKLWAEAVTQTYKDQIETFVVRPFNIYGSGQNPAYGYAIHNFARAIKETGVVDIFGDGEQTRDFISVGDVCKTRSGAQAQAGQLARSRVATVVAVSCNPGTLSRDVRILVDTGQPVARIAASPRMSTTRLL